MPFFGADITRPRNMPNLGGELENLTPLARPYYTRLQLPTRLPVIPGLETNNAKAMGVIHTAERMY